MKPRLALDENQVAVLVHRKQKDPTKKRFVICDFGCNPTCRSGHRKIKIIGSCYEVDEGAPFQLSYRKKGLSGVPVFLPVIPIGDNGDSILKDSLLEWMKTTMDAVKFDKYRAIGFLKSRFYYLHSDEWIEQLFVKLLQNEHHTVGNPEMFELQEISKKNAKEIRGCVESIQNLGEIINGAMKTQQALIEQLASTSKDHDDQLTELKTVLADLLAVQTSTNNLRMRPEVEANQEHDLVGSTTPPLATVRSPKAVLEVPESYKKKVLKSYVKGSEDLNRAMWSSGRNLDHETRVRRDAIITVLKTLVPFEGKVFRALNYSTPLEQEFVCQLMRKPVDGEYITFKEMGFCSTSLDSFDDQKTNQFKTRKYRFHIQSKSARDISLVYKNNKTFQNEREVLFAPETEFRVKSWREEGSKISFEVEEIGPSPFLTEFV